MSLRRIILLLCLAGGCAHQPEPPHAVTIEMCADLAGGNAAWEVEALKRFDNPIIFQCHGTTRNGIWVCSPDNLPQAPVETIAAILAKLYPHREIVLCVCNRDGHVIHQKRVYYARQLVWSKPIWPRVYTDEFGARWPITGSIWDFAN
jgi:hypothetical protein